MMRTKIRRATVAASLGFAALAGWSGTGAADRPPAGVPACPTSEDAPAAPVLLERLEQLMQGGSSVATMTMTIKTRSWSRAVKMKVWTKGKDLALVRILEGGPREKGMMTLKRDRQLWNYLPQAGRVMKLPSGMLGDSWMGSDFTNDDLVHGTSLVRDFSSRVLGTALHDGRKAWRLQLVPKPDAPVVWGKIDVVLDRATCVPLVERFYDEDGQVARTMSFSDIRAVGWRQFPTRMTVRPADKGRETDVVYGDIEFDTSVPDDTFSLHRLQQGR